MEMKKNIKNLQVFQEIEVVSLCWGKMVLYWLAISDSMTALPFSKALKKHIIIIVMSLVYTKFILVLLFRKPIAYRHTFEIRS
jgi:hypothetical protein